MSRNTPADPVTVELFVRSLAPRAGHPKQEAIIERLERLEAAGRIESVTVHVWGRQVSLSTAAAGTDAGTFVLDRIEQFREWAEDTDYCVESVFERRRVCSEFTGERYSALVLPMVALAEYHDGELAFVAPCADSNGTYPVTERLDRLAAGARTQGPDSGGTPMLAAENE